MLHSWFPDPTFGLPRCTDTHVNMTRSEQRVLINAILDRQFELERSYNWRIIAIVRQEFYTTHRYRVIRVVRRTLRTSLMDEVRAIQEYQNNRHLRKETNEEISLPNRCRSTPINNKNTHCP